ncbi:MAG: SDR family NAD(P)-dependent oxidoreductase, partial [Bacteroidales bacterium]|nr:SDR family NAD(P)-dependent oxidoreductase [Bacteroidales bacterium]
MAENLNKLNGKTIVITGASSGFGRGSVLRLAESGANIVAAARRSKVLEELSSQIVVKGGNVSIVTCDVSKFSDIEKLAQNAIDNFGTIDIWINNVGIGALGFFWDIPIQDHARLIDVNLKGLVYGSYVAIQHFIMKEKGILINIGSIDSEVPLAMQTHMQ